MPNYQRFHLWTCLLLPEDFFSFSCWSFFLQLSQSGPHSLIHMIFAFFFDDRNFIRASSIIQPTNSTVGTGVPIANVDSETHVVVCGSRPDANSNFSFHGPRFSIEVFVAFMLLLRTALSAVVAQDIKVDHHTKVHLNSKPDADVGLVPSLHPTTTIKTDSHVKDTVLVWFSVQLFPVEPENCSSTLFHLLVIKCIHHFVQVTAVSNEFSFAHFSSCDQCLVQFQPCISNTRYQAEVHLADIWDGVRSALVIMCCRTWRNNSLAFGALNLQFLLCSATSCCCYCHSAPARLC